MKMKNTKFHFGSVIGLLSLVSVFGFFSVLLILTFALFLFLLMESLTTKKNKS